ncbi:MAG TPA: putative phosphothreonine lyase domain-containing protein [Verrucomicrobiae bacterium]|nr:putative phosphothreonine lyase domain-containing protein [Verrucomicrobiae bacterium]
MTERPELRPCANGLGYHWDAIEHHLSPRDMDRFGDFISGQTTTECPEHPGESLVFASDWQAFRAGLPAPDDPAWPNAARRRAPCPCAERLARLPATVDRGRWLSPDIKVELPEDLAPVGKWLVPVPCRRMVGTWRKIAGAVQDRQLWSAKASASLGVWPTHVICVYTPDCRDVAGILAAAQVLNGLGVVPAGGMGYKPDHLSRLGIDSHSPRGETVYRYRHRQLDLRPALADLPASWQRVIRRAHGELGGAGVDR